MEPFMLYPDMPAGGWEKSAMPRYNKPGMGKTLRKEAGIEGLHLKYRLIDHIPNSLNAHSLISKLSSSAEKWKMAMNIYKSYFEEGQDIGNWNVLEEIIRTAGMSILPPEAPTPGSKQADELMRTVLRIRVKGVRTVPYILIQEIIPLTGLYDTDVLESYIRRASKICR